MNPSEDFSDLGFDFNDPSKSIPNSQLNLNKSNMAVRDFTQDDYGIPNNLSFDEQVKGYDKNQLRDINLFNIKLGRLLNLKLDFVNQIRVKERELLEIRSNYASREPYESQLIQQINSGKERVARLDRSIFLLYEDTPFASRVSLDMA